MSQMPNKAQLWHWKWITHNCLYH